MYSTNVIDRLDLQQPVFLHLQHTLLPFGLHAIPRSQIRHQVTRQKLGRPRPPHLSLQVSDRHLDVRVFHSRNKLLDPRGDRLDQGINILHSNRFASVEACIVVNPLPELHSRNFCSRRVFHEIIERNTPVSADPCSSVRERGGNVATHSVVGDSAGNFGAKQVGGANLYFLAEGIILWTQK
jgi:hypothetical protein